MRVRVDDRVTIGKGNRLWQVLRVDGDTCVLKTVDRDGVQSVFRGEMPLDRLNIHISGFDLETMETLWREKLHAMNNDTSTTNAQYAKHIRLGFEKGCI